MPTARSTDGTDRTEGRDWAVDFDHTTEAYAAAAPEIWDELRSRCPVAHTDRFGGAWFPSRHEDVAQIAHDTEHFSSAGVIVNDWNPLELAPVGYAPPITSDPPFHESARKLLLTAFSPRAVRELEPLTRAFCHELIDDLLAGLAGTGPDTVVDAAAQFSQHIPVRVISHMVGVPASDGDKFRTFIHRILEKPGEFSDIAPEDTMSAYLWGIVTAHRDDPRSDRHDLIDHLLAAEIGGVPLDEEHIVGTVALLIIAGIDTTWSAIGASLWHLAQHPEHRRRLIDEPALVPFAIEELLRAYAPVTMARIVNKDVEVGGVQMARGEWVLLPFPSANRDPDFFERPDEVLLDRQKNRHSAFGLGIHRCLGSNLARMELTVAVQTWLERVPEFELADPAAVRWSTGQVRGPRTLPVRLLTRSEARA